VGNVIRHYNANYCKAQLMINLRIIIYGPNERTRNPLNKPRPRDIPVMGEG
jgi:hypothetical protein